MVEAIREAEKDATVKAIVLRVDSPGGSALASDLIWHELKQCKKPVVASMGDVAASGGYYISMAAKKIYAEPGTLTGSIGVVGGKIVIGGRDGLGRDEDRDAGPREERGHGLDVRPVHRDREEGDDGDDDGGLRPVPDKALEGRNANGVKMTGRSC